MPTTDTEKWNLIYASGDHDQNGIADILQDYDHLLPLKGTALDIACGTGKNAIFLASRGLKTYAWDISEQAISKLKSAAKQYHYDVLTEIRDVIKYPPAEDTYDVIFVSHFLDRGLFSAIINALHMDGLLFYQTFIQEKTHDTGPVNTKYLLAPNELLQLCKDLHILIYREEGKTGSTDRGFRNEAMLIGQRRQ